MYLVFSITKLQRFCVGNQTFEKQYRGKNKISQYAEASFMIRNKSNDG